MPCAGTTDTLDFAGIVLAGGASSRMGRDKATLALHGRSLLQHAVDTLRAAGADPVLVSGDRPGFDCVPDRTPGLGPLGGLASVLTARPDLHDRLLLVMAVDTPRLQPPALRALARAAGRQGPGAHFERNPLPLAVRADSAAIGQIGALLHGTGPASVHRLAACLGIQPVAAHGADLTNVNTTDDWRRIETGQP
jgi:molybdenum cofactor guanylyltransferase